MKGNISCMMKDLMVKVSYFCIDCLYSKKVSYIKYMHGMSEVGSYLNSGQGPMG